MFLARFPSSLVHCLHRCAAQPWLVSENTLPRTNPRSRATPRMKLRVRVWSTSMPSFRDSGKGILTVQAKGCLDDSPRVRSAHSVQQASYQRVRGNSAIKRPTRTTKNRQKGVSLAPTPATMPQLSPAPASRHQIDTGRGRLHRAEPSESRRWRPPGKSLHAITAAEPQQGKNGPSLRDMFRSSRSLTVYLAAITTNGEQRMCEYSVLLSQVLLPPSLQYDC